MSVEAVDMRYSYLARDFPGTTFWGIDRHSKLATSIGANSQEIALLRGAAGQLYNRSAEKLAEVKPQIKSGHVVFVPSPVTWEDIVLRREDPLRPGKKLQLLHLAFVEPMIGEKILQKLQTKLPDFVVVTYPFESQTLSYGTYKDFYIHTVKATRMINCDATKRGKINEIVVTNYPIKKQNQTKLTII